MSDITLVYIILTAGNNSMSVNTIYLFFKTLPSRVEGTREREEDGEQVKELCVAGPPGPPGPVGPQVRNTKSYRCPSPDN